MLAMICFGPMSVTEQLALIYHLGARDELYLSHSNQSLQIPKTTALYSSIPYRRKIAARRWPTLAEIAPPNGGTTPDTQ